MRDIAKAAVPALLLAAGAACSGGEAVRVVPDSLAPLADSAASIEVAWSQEVAGLEDSAHALELDARAPCTMGRDGAIVRFREEDGELLDYSSPNRPAWTDAACAGAIRAFVDADNRLVALGDDSQVMWQTPLGGTPAGAPAFFPGGRALVVQDGSGRVISYDAQSGEENWSFSVQTGGLRIAADAGPVLAGDFVLVGFHNGKLYAINRQTGLDAWEVAVAVPEGAHEFARLVHVNPPAWRDSTACATSYRGSLACIDLRSGGLLWSRDFSSTKRPVLGPGIVAALAEGDVVHAFSLANGAPVWTNDTMKNRGLRLLGASGEVVLLGDYEGYAHALDAATGRALARTRVADGPLVSAAAASGSDFVVRSADGVLARIRLAGF